VGICEIEGFDFEWVVSVVASFQITCAIGASEQLPRVGPLSDLVYVDKFMH
jgi:hypothetical protein